MIKGTGYYFDGALYQTYYKGKHIGAFVSCVIAWREIGFQQRGASSMSEFSKLSPQAREIAHELAKVANGDLKRLVRLLDADMAFREAIGVTDMDVYPCEVDYVVRFFQSEGV